MNRGTKVFSLMIAVVVGVLQSSTAQADPTCTIVSSTEHIEGVSVAGVGDVDADGYSDFIVAAAPGRTAQVLSGKDGTLLFEIVSSQASGIDQFGLSVASVADLNGDGNPDILIGAPSSTDVLQFSGRVDVFDGQTGAFLYKVIATEPGALFGSSVDGIGDINGDGFGDFIVGAPENSSNAGPNGFGNAYVYSGVDGSLIYSYAGVSTFRFGRAVAGIGDLDNDGIPDFASANGANLMGLVSVYSGATGALLYDIPEQSSIEQFGASISTAGDVNLDGHADILVGAPNSSVTGPADGQAYVFSGQTGGLLFSLSPDTSMAPFSHAFFGYSVDGGKDVDGDGIPDIVVGANLEADDSGKVYVFSGADQSRIAVETGRSRERLGWNVALVGDVNGDCLSDVAVVARSFTHLFMFQNSCARPAACSGCCNISGDANNDGAFNISDVTFGIARVFSGGGAPACQDEADANGDSAFNIADVTFGISRIFSGGPPPICGTAGL